jgi:hypothetical protein
MNSLTDCKTIEEVKSRAVALTHEAMDIVNDPVVQAGYQLSGQPAQIAFLNVNSMAKTRLAKMFPAADWHDPLFATLMAEAKCICAQCIKLKYECRDRRQPYDHLKDATERIKSMVRRCFNDYSNTIKRLTNE